MAKQIPLQDWAARHYDPPPSIRTLRSWARDGRIYPEPVMVGREYRVREDAEYLPAQRSLRMPTISVIDSEDSVVNDIINSGKTSQRRQA